MKVVFHRRWKLLRLEFLRTAETDNNKIRASPINFFSRDIPSPIYTLEVQLAYADGDEGFDNFNVIWSGVTGSSLLNLADLK